MCSVFYIYICTNIYKTLIFFIVFLSVSIYILCNLEGQNFRSSILPPPQLTLGYCTGYEWMGPVQPHSSIHTLRNLLAEETEMTWFGSHPDESTPNQDRVL